MNKLSNHKTNGVVLTSNDSDDESSTKNIDETEKSIMQSYSNILESIGEDPSRDGLLKTPERAAKAMLYFTKGYKQDLKSKLS